jgi:hypothetical protein
MPSVEDSGSDSSNCVAEDAPLPPFLIGFRNVGGSNVGGSGVEAAEELESAAESAADFEDEVEAEEELEGEVEAEEELTDEVEAASKGEEPFRREDVRRKLKESYM